MQMSSRRPTRN